MNQTLVQVQTLATYVGTNLFPFISDFLIVLVLVVALFLFARTAGRGRFIAFFISLYIGYALYIVFPFIKYLPSTPAITALVSDVAVFGALSIAAYILLRNVVVSDFVSISTIGLVILSLLGTGFLLALAYQIFPVRSVYTFTPAIDVFFVARAYFFWWFIAPLIGLFIFAR